MDVNDQVAIHEAMEQQSITITKAGISATLNARASVLAAANPIHGRYDRSKTLKANVNLSPPILSRFDLFFVVLDECNPDSDRRVARHILNVHRCQEEQSAAVPFTKEQLQRYIRFAKTFQPKLNEESQKVLVDSYSRLRQSNARSAYRVTVRQLESMIRLSEAMARLHCDPEVQPRYVEEAYRLLRTSIIQVETGDVDVGSDNDDDDDDDDGNNGAAAANPPNNNGGDKDDNGDDGAAVAGTSLPLDESEDGPETQLKETLQDEEDATEPQGPPRKKTKRQKTTMSYEEYALMSNTIAAHLRSLEEENKEHMKWKQVIDWYVARAGQDNEDTRRKVNLLLRRLLHKENVLVTIGTPPKTKREEPGTVLAVHPNYVIS
jgi:DNA replication licensing factor MCM6